jgi:chromosome partitioning protein
LTKVITFASSKGGVGKSTLCINISAYFAKSGKSVSVIDADPQRSSFDWIRESSDEHLSMVSAFHLRNENEIEANISKSICDVICIDLQGSLNNSLPFSLAIADLIIVPCRPSRDDIVGLGWMVKLTKEVSSKYPESSPKLAAVMNGVNSKSRVFLHAKEQIEADGIFLLSNTISQSVAFSEANINRSSVFESMDKASRTISSIGVEISGILNF